MRLLITINEASEVFGLPYAVVRKLVNENKVKNKKVGKKYYIQTADMLEYLGFDKKEENKNESTSSKRNSGKIQR
ncbi:MAG: helix-turn-helix domain-containing protein [Lachnospiraceae bacterium]|nr:helix-turn-helix domain-containing protein [Lachnospiraceae bacterium]